MSHVQAVEEPHQIKNLIIVICTNAITAKKSSNSANVLIAADKIIILHQKR
jgi:hypothetical protein